jgi:acetate kinase
MQEKLGRLDINIISCHIGSGGSITCIKNGQSIDTTMGFSPNSGMMMGTRSGDIDYSIIPYYMEKTGKTLNEVDNILNKQSGLLGISGTSSDHRDIEVEINNGSEKAKLADEMYINRIVDYIAKYYVKLDGKVDALVFTAGLGENAREFRSNVVRKLHSLGMILDEEENMHVAGFLNDCLDEGVISSADSKVPIYVVPTNEELMIALDTYDLIK